MRKKKEVDFYFGETEEKAVCDYINAETPEERNYIYEIYLKAPIEKMSEIVLKRYPINTGNHEIEEVVKYGIAHLIQNIVKFNPNRISQKTGLKTRAYSYCQTILRNYYKDFGKRSYNEVISNLWFDEYVDKVEELEENMYEMEDETDKLDNLMNGIIKSINQKVDSDLTLNSNEIVVGQAISNILSNWTILFQEEVNVCKFDKKISSKLAKNKILLFLKEQTGLSTKDIRVALKPFKELYFLSRNEFYS